jgi:SHS2 domain-containing protein
MGFEPLEDIVMADVAFRASGKDLSELFISAANAVIAAMLEDPGTLAHVTQREFTLSNTETDLLLYDFLSEFLYYKDAESLLLLPETVKIVESGGELRLHCLASGETILKEKHALLVDVKAVTMHRFRVERDEKGWSAVVVLDV